MRPASALLVLLACTGCQVGSAPGSGGQAAPVVTDPDGLTGAIGASAPWQILDLASGALTIAATAPVDLLANPDYRDRLMVFRRIEAGSARLGQAGGTFARQDDEDARAQPVPACYLAVFECTRAQWRRLAGGSPWSSLVPAPAGGDDHLPALGLSFTRATADLAVWNHTHRPLLALPEADQWEAAARAGTGTVYPWGDAHDGGTVARYAVTWDTGGAPAVVGGRLANPIGLYDVCGNAWELCADGGARGGSYADAISIIRPANYLHPNPETSHTALGARLRLIP